MCCINAIKDIFEIVYYIAFIVLTVLLVIYAIMTYYLESKREYNLLCQFRIRTDAVGEHGYGFALEIYNAGNAVAKNIEVFSGEQKITTVDFIRPNGSFVYPVGSVVQTMGRNLVYGSTNLSINEGEETKISLHVDGKVLDYSINPDIIFISRISTGTLQGVERAIEKVANKIGAKR